MVGKIVVIFGEVSQRGQGGGKARISARPSRPYTHVAMTRAEPSNLAQRAQRVHRLAGELGFALVGVARAEVSGHESYIRQWLSEGKHGEMDYLAQRLEQRLDPEKLLPGARSVICVADRHAANETPCEPATNGSEEDLPAAGRIARYAWGDDYHKVMKKRLIRLADALRSFWPSEDYRVAVDTAPVLERELAQRAGLGWIGKNTLLLHPRLGSYLLLGEIVTTLAIQPTFESGAAAITDHCGTCTRCLDACPTACLQPRQLDAQRCISYLTLEHRGPIEPRLQGMMGQWIAGCDACQEVCPFNAETHATPTAGPDAPLRPEYATRPPAPTLNLLELLGWKAEDRQRAFTNSALKRLKLDQLKRNALIAAGNFLADHDSPLLRQRVTELAENPGESALLRQTARQVLERLDALGR